MRLSLLWSLDFLFAVLGKTINRIKIAVNVLTSQIGFDTQRLEIRRILT